MLIKKLDIFVLKNYLTLFAGTFCVSLFVVMMQFLWKFVDELVGKGLTIDVLARFFFYAGETLVPMALPLAILLASLISFGNMGERLELLAIKASGVPLFRVLRPLIVLNIVLSFASYYFQDQIVPQAQTNLMQLLLSMKQKSPELEIPEGVFYDGIDNINLYVKKKNKQTGMLYDVIIYNMTDGVNKAHIILADSARLESSSDKKNLLLHLFAGEQFENLNNNALQARNVPYRRETFVEKHFLIDFDANFNMADQESVSGAAITKDVKTLRHDIDSLESYYDSLSVVYCREMHRNTLHIPRPTVLSDYDSLTISTFDSVRIATLKAEEAKQKAEKKARQSAIPQSKVNIDSLLAHMDSKDRQRALMAASQKVNFQQMDTDYKSAVMQDGDKQIRRHWRFYWEKSSKALSCLIFFFIGAPLGAIIRKGGLGMPVIVAVCIFLFYYIIDTMGMKSGREGSIPVWFGMWLSTMVLVPMGVWFTVKSNNDSAVFNMDAYTMFFRKLWGIRTKRHITRKEVIINDPDYALMSRQLGALTADCHEYLKTHRRHSLPGYLVYIAYWLFGKQRDEEAERINDHMELIVESLGNSRDRVILRDLNGFPVMEPRDFRFYRRRKRDMKAIIRYGEQIKQYIDTTL